MEKLKFTCKYCNQKLEADLDWVGEKVLCPTCQKELVVSAIIDDGYIVLQENIEKHPDLSAFDRAKLLIKEHEFNAACNLLRSSDLSSSEHLVLEIEFFFEKKEWEKAKTLAELYIKLYPDSAIGYRWLAEILDDGFDDKKEAIAMATKAIKLDRKFAEAYVIRGNAKRWLSPADDEGAEIDYNKALQINSTSSLAYNGLGWIYYNKADYLKAEKFFSNSIKHSKTPLYGTTQGLALVFLSTGKLEAADKAIRDAINQNETWYLYETQAHILYNMAQQCGGKDAREKCLMAFQAIGNAAALAPFCRLEKLFVFSCKMMKFFKQY